MNIKKWWITVVMVIIILITPVVGVYAEKTCDVRQMLAMEYLNKLDSSPTVIQSWKDGLKTKNLDLKTLSISHTVYQITQLTPPYAEAIVELSFTAVTTDCDGLEVIVRSNRLLRYIVDTKICKVVDVEILGDTGVQILQRSI